MRNRYASSMLVEPAVNGCSQTFLLHGERPFVSESQEKNFLMEERFPRMRGYPWAVKPISILRSMREHMSDSCEIAHEIHQRRERIFILRGEGEFTSDWAAFCH